MMTDSHIYTT